MLREITNFKCSIKWNRNEMRRDVKKILGKWAWKKTNERIHVRIAGYQSRS